MLNIGHIWRVQLLYLICLLSHEQKNVDSFFVPNIFRPFSSNSFSILPLYQTVGNAFSATTCKTRLFSGPDQCHRKSVEWGIKNNPKLTWSKGPPTQQTVRHSRKYGNIHKKSFLHTESESFKQCAMCCGGWWMSTCIFFAVPLLSGMIVHDLHFRWLFKQMTGTVRNGDERSCPHGPFVCMQKALLVRRTRVGACIRRIYELPGILASFVVYYAGGCPFILHIVRSGLI